MKGQVIDNPVSIEVEGINSRGFGTVPQTVMRDPSLSVEAKAIYAYLCSFAGAGGKAFPSRQTMLDELGISKSRYYKHREQLIAKGLVRVEYRTEVSPTTTPVNRTVYILAAEVPSRTIAPGQGECPQNRDTGEAEVGEFSTIPRSRRMSSKQGHPLRDGRECPQNEDRACPQNKDTINTVKSNKENKPTNLPINLTGDKGAQAVGRSEIAKDYSALCSRELTPNRNRLNAGFAAYAELRRAFTASVIAAAWHARQTHARDAGWTARYYPQLASWLDDDGPDGAAAMCAAVQEQRDERLRHDVRLALSLDDDYMAMQAEVEQIAQRYRDAGEPDEAVRGDARYVELVGAMDTKRAAAYEEVRQRKGGAK